MQLIIIKLSYFFLIHQGTSDPYVKFKIGNNEVGRSQVIKKNLDPIWDEEFNITIDDVRTGLFIQVCFTL